MIVGNHKTVMEYDGAFKCAECCKSWGALPGDPQEPKHCNKEAMPTDIEAALKAADTTEAVIKAGQSFVLHGNYEELVVLAQAFRSSQEALAAKQKMIETQLEDEIALTKRAEADEAELSKLRDLMSGRTVSCSNCEGMARELAKLREQLQKEKHLNEIYGTAANHILRDQAEKADARLDTITKDCDRIKEAAERVLTGLRACGMAYLDDAKALEQALAPSPVDREAGK